MPTSFFRVATLPITVLFLSLLIDHVSAQVPLISRRYNWTNLPDKADPNDGPRGIQTGTNRCNATTQNQNSTCQTAVINSIDDFCLWGSPTPNSMVADVEGEMVAWCTTNKYGTRIIPQGALTGVQFMRTPSYIQVTGRINQTLIDLAADDFGGEMDPIGADGRGNPLGGLIYSTAFSNVTAPAPNATAPAAAFQQVIYYHNFMGGNIFCLKACNPTANNQPSLCQHIYDRIGCAYNAPAAYVDGAFETCLGDDQLPPGVYVGGNGQTSTYTQPPESLGPITTLPYVAAIPASSSCTPVDSAGIFTAAAQLAASSASSVSSVASVSSVSAASVSSVSSVSRASVSSVSSVSAASVSSMSAESASASAASASAAEASSESAASAAAAATATAATPSATAAPRASAAGDRSSGGIVVLLAALLSVVVALA